MDDRAAKVVLEEEEEERVCMQVLCSDYGKNFRRDVETYKWYVDVIDHQAAAAAAASNAVEIQGMCRPFYRFTGAASSNSTVYVFGGHHFHTVYSPIPNNAFDLDSPLRFQVLDPLVSDVWYNDTFIKNGDDDDDIYASYASGGWIRGASMLHSRITPRTISMEEKIYVFGGASSPLTPATWAEVYDIKSDSWSSLPPPPANLLTDNIRNEPLFVYKCAALDFDFPVDIGHNTTTTTTNKLILVYFLGPALYSYDVKLGTWEVLDASFGSIEHDLAVVSCRDTSTPVLLTVKEDDGKLYGYHLGKKKWFDSPVNVDGQDNAIPHPDLEGFIRSFHLIPLGRNNDKLCYLWSYYPNDNSGLWVHCTKLSFYYDGHSSLSAKVESTNLFKLRHVDKLHCCLPLVTHCRGTKRAGVSLCTEEEEEEKKNKH